MKIMRNMLYNLNEDIKKDDFKIVVTLLCLSPLISFWSIEMLQGGNLFELHTNALLTNLFCYIFVYAFLFSLIKSTKYTTIIGNILFFIIGTTNHFVEQFRNTPILPSDLRSFKTATSVAGHFTYNFLDYNIIIPFIVLAIVLVISTLNKNYTWKNTLKINLALVVLFLTIGITSALTVYKTDFLKNIGLTVNLWEQNVGYRENGFLASFINNSKFLIVEKPENYDPDTIGQTLLASSSNDSIMTFSNNVASQNKRPNIIAIMNESFGDPSVIADFKTNEDYMPFIRNMNENTIRGNMLVSVFGGNTCNSEFEFLTGNSMAFLPSGSIPYQQYVTSPMGNLTSILNEQGYESTAIHPYPGTGWNRNGVYKNFGFSEFYDLDDFVDPSYYRCYISDESSYDKIKEVLENNKDNDKPQFIFNVTIQNHGGYNFGEDEFKSDIKITDMENTTQADQYLSLAKHSDDAFKNLISYLEGIDEPTMVLFFGDHMPPIEQKFYEEIYKKRGTSLFTLNNLEDLQTKFTVPFRIWANYDIEEQDLGIISANYLSSILLNTANLEMSDYNKFLLKLREEIPAMNVNGYIGADGKYYRYDEESPYSKDLEEYEKYQYNNLFDKSHKDEQKFNVS